MPIQDESTHLTINPWKRHWNWSRNFCTWPEEYMASYDRLKELGITFVDVFGDSPGSEEKLAYYGGQLSGGWRAPFINLWTDGYKGDHEFFPDSKGRLWFEEAWGAIRTFPNQVWTEDEWHKGLNLLILFPEDYTHFQVGMACRIDTLMAQWECARSIALILNLTEKTFGGTAVA